jgi:hypothetical protein
LWFLNRKQEWLRSLFLGFGGYTMVFMKPDPNPAPPALPDYPGLRANPTFQKHDVDGLWETAFLLSDSFGPWIQA